VDALAQIGRIWRVWLVPVTPGAPRGRDPWIEIGARHRLAGGGSGATRRPASAVVDVGAGMGGRGL